MRSIAVLIAMFYVMALPEAAMRATDSVVSTESDDHIKYSSERFRRLSKSSRKQAERWLQQGELKKAREAIVQARIAGIRAGEGKSVETELLAAAVDYSAMRYSEAESTLKDLVENLPEKSNAKSVALNNLGNVFVAKGQMMYALQSYRQAFSLADDMQTQLRMKALLNSVYVLVALGKQTEAVNVLGQAIEDLREIPADANKVGLLLRAAQSAGEVAETSNNDIFKKQRYELLSEAEELSKQYDRDFDRAAVLLELASLYADYQRFSEGLTLSREALFYVQQANASPLLVKAHWQIARFHAALQNERKSLNSYRDAVAILKLNSNQFSLFRTGRYEKPIESLLEAAADIVLRNAENENNENNKKILLEEARQIVEMTRAESLKRYFRDDCVADLQDRTKGVEKLDARTLVIYPIALPDRLELILSGKDFITHIRVPVSKQALDNALYNLRTNLQHGSKRAYLYSAEEVYRWLIQPIEAILSKRKPDTLVFVPNATLQMVPLAVLFDGDQYLVERYAVATTPGLALTDPRRFEGKELLMLIAGVSDSVQGYSDLPFVENEVRALAERYRSRLLLNGEFTVPALEKELGKTAFPIVHLASHGRFEADTNASYILAYDSQMGVNDIQSVLTAGRFQDAPVELMTLSACSTAVGDARSALGLGGLAVKSGARTALASLWLVNDRATDRLMRMFYRKLAVPGVSRARALQEAQLHMLSHPRYRNPSYWSAFVLVGNWQ